MATKKAVAPAAKKATTTAMTVWEQEMAEAAVAQGATENATGGFKSISTRGGILSVDDNPVEDNELRVIILASIHENQYYTSDFDPGKITTPACYAFGKVEKGMAPMDESPEKQNEVCEGCWANEFGTADKGKGKACKNVRRLLCITEDALESAGSLEEAEARMLKLPVMSVKNWTQYVKSTLEDNLKRPSWGVVTTIKVVPDAKSQFRVMFKFEELVNFDSELYLAMKKKAAEAEKNISGPYPVFEEEVKPQRGKKVIPIVKTGGKPTAKPAVPLKKGKF
jgi:hypothetical protein